MEATVIKGLRIFWDADGNQGGGAAVAEQDDGEYGMIPDDAPEQPSEKALRDQLNEARRAELEPSSEAETPQESEAPDEPEHPESTDSGEADVAPPADDTLVQFATSMLGIDEQSAKALDGAGALAPVINAFLANQPQQQPLDQTQWQQPQQQYTQPPPNQPQQQPAQQPDLSFFDYEPELPDDVDPEYAKAIKGISQHFAKFTRRLAVRIIEMRSVEPLPPMLMYRPV